MTMQFQFDVLSQVNVSHGTEFCEYDLFDDAPENFNFGGWITNIVIGVAVAAVCVLGAVFTGGLLGAALLGAAIGAAAVTATSAIEDMNDGEVRSAKAAVGQIACGAIAGAAIGYTGAYVMPFGVGTIGTHATFGVLSGATMRVATSGAMEHMDMVDRLGYIFNPLYVAGDALGAAFLGGLANRSALGTAFPTQEMVSSYNAARQSAMQAARTAPTEQDSPDQSGLLPEQKQLEGSGGIIAKVDNALPNVENATIDPRKLTEYALNPNHPVGSHKARVFNSVLGYNQSNAESLINQIYEKLPQCEAKIGVLDIYGQRFTVDIPIIGPNGNTAIVRTGWIIRPNSMTPELTTLFVQ